MYAILTPTYIGHFQFIEPYLKSFDTYVTDKINVKQYFIINEDESLEFEKIIKKYPDIKIEVLYFEDLLKKFGINYTPSQLYEKFDKFTYQTLKKLYGILHIPEQECLIIDSESMFIKETRVHDLFEQNRSRKTIFFTKLSNRQSTADFFYKLVKTHSRILEISDIWFLEHVNWFFEKKIIEDIIRHIGSPIDIALKTYKIGVSIKDCDRHLFEGLLYYGWIYKNKEKYNDYTICDIDEELKANLSNEDLAEYDRHFYKKFKGQAGRIEFALSLLNNHNINAFIGIYKRNNIQILRCETSTIQTYLFQKELIDILDIKILSCSQNHCFGLNSKNTLKSLILNDAKLFKHWNNLRQTREFFKCFIYQLSEIFIILLLVLQIPFNMFMYLFVKLMNLK